MLNIHFDEADHRIPAPRFSLPDDQGSCVSSGDFYESANLVLLFLHGPGCAVCQSFLCEVSRRRADFAGEAARLVAIYSQPVEALRGIPPVLRGEIRHLSDEDGAVRKNYLDLMADGLVKPGEVMLFVLDAYGAPYACLKGEEPEISAIDDLLAWLRFISIQCPE
jgi:peroxiredoxin